MKTVNSKTAGRKLHLLYLRKFEPGYLEPFERKVYSQNGEDGIIKEVFERIGIDSKFAVEFGVEDGSECNSRLLLTQGWDVLQMDGSSDGTTHIKKEFITAKNINNIFKKHNVPENLDLLSIDIDSNDYWVWKSLGQKYKPKLVIIEYNAGVPPWQSKAIVHDDKRVWDGTMYFGGSLLAMCHIAQEKGYSLIYCNVRGVNAFFVRNDLIPGRFIPKTANVAYRGPSFGIKNSRGDWVGHRQDDLLRMVDVD